MPIVSSITSTTATVSWTPYGGASHTIVYYQVQGAGSWSSVNVAGSSYNLTGLLPCHTYEVRLRSLCGSVFVSDYTDIETFNTESSNPSVDLSASMVNYDCLALISATSGFVSYIWTKTGSTDTVISHGGDTTNLAAKNPGTYHVKAIDANGCIAIDSIVISSGMFVNGCITDAHNELLSDSLEAHIVQVTSDMNLLAKGLAGLISHSGIKNIVKTLVLGDDDYQVKIADLSTECTANSINLKSEIQTVLHSNGHSASDTARVGAVMNGFTYNFSGVPSTTFYPSIYYHHLDPEFTSNVIGSWDTLTATYVMTTVGNGTSPYDSYGLFGGVVFSTEISHATLLESPNWQIFIKTAFPNSWGTDPIAAPKVLCRNHTSHTTAKTYCLPATKKGCGPPCGFSTGDGTSKMFD